MLWGRNWRWAALVGLLLGFPLTALGQGTSSPLITQAVDESKQVRLAGNTHPLALPQFDQGPAPAGLSLQRMLLVLKRSPAQESALETLLEQQQYKVSPNYHKWLTPDEFGLQFGPSDQDIQTVASWLTSHGFQVAKVSRGKNVIEFSGTAEQVQEAFHTTIHSYVVKGIHHWANASDPEIPAALAPAVVGVESLNNFARKAAHSARAFAKQPVFGNWTTANPTLTFPCGTNPNNGATIYCNGITPYDFATIYNVLPLWSAASPIDGTGQSIAIVARSDINLQDVDTYRSIFGLPLNVPQVIVDGPDPGLVPGDETEADLDVELSGGVAKGAIIKVVVSASTETTDGVDLSALYIVDNDVAPIMSASFGECELFLGAAGNQFYSNLWQQAAAEGISVFVATGDQGSAGCDFFQGSTPEPARNGLQVSGLASTPYNVAVGGTDFNDFFNQLTYWNTFNNQTTQESAKGYIPEMAWNNSCTNAIFARIGFGTNAESNCNDSRLSGFVVTVGGSGGKSSCTSPAGSGPTGCAGGYAKPSWQIGSGVPSDTKRDLPDVSLFSASIAGTDAYAICEADFPGAGGCSATNFVAIGGTSASTPAFAGLMALVDQKTSSRQGNPNFVLYKLAAQQSPSNCNSSTGPGSTCVFNDVTSGTIAMPCANGSPNCKTSNSGDLYGILSGYDTGSGYDLATGLGSVNAANLVNNWNSVTFTPSKTTLTLNGGSTVNITHGTPVNVVVSVLPASPLPTGNVSLVATQGANTFGFDTMTLSGGMASGTTNMLPGGTSYIVKAHYAGDGAYGGSDSNAVTVNVNPEASKTNLRIVTFDPTTGQVTNPDATNFPYGSAYLLRAEVTNSTSSSCFSSSTSSLAYACPTGAILLFDNGNVLNGGDSFFLNSQGYTEDQLPLQLPSTQLPGGAHALGANYSGDQSYAASSAPTDAITITLAPTTTSAVSNPPLSTVVIGSTFAINGLTKSQSIGGAPTGTYTVFDGTTPLSGTGFFNGFPGSPTQTAFCQGNIVTSLSAPSGPHTLTIKYSGDTNYASSTSANVSIYALYPTTMSAASNPSSIILGQSVTATTTVSTGNPATNAALKPTGTVSFPGVSNPVTTIVGQDSNGNWILQAAVTFSPQSTYSAFAAYSGDSNYAASNVDVFVNVTIPDFSISPSSTPLVITAGQSGNTTLTITPLSSNTSTVALSCGSVAISGATCTISPSSVTLSNNKSATATLTISTLAPSSSTSAVAIPARLRPSWSPPLGGEPWWMLSILAGLATLLLLALPTRRRYLRAASGLALLCLVSFALGCGGGATASSPPVSTTTTISTPSTKISQGSTLTLTANVNSSKAVTGTVTFTLPGCCFFLGTVSNGTAQVQIPTASNTLVPGTYAFNAQYGGDANNLPSQSGNLDIAITGTTSQQVIGQISILSHQIPVSVTIQ